MKKRITEKELKEYSEYLYKEEKTKSTIDKYIRDLRKLMDYAGEQELTKEVVIAYKTYLQEEKHFKISSMNSYLVAANRFFEYKGWHELRVKTYKVQRETYVSEKKELTKQEYDKLLKAAKDKGKMRLYMAILTICSTGIRVGELKFITVKAVEQGEATVYNKAKERKILLSRDLQVKLLQYIRTNKIREGEVFRTSTGKTLNRSYIWREMQKLSEEAGVDKKKVFPHNLRHLFAKTYYNLHKDIAKLADFLGHSNIETTRFYIKTTCNECRRQLDEMGLVC